MINLKQLYGAVVNDIDDLSLPEKWDAIGGLIKHSDDSVRETGVFGLARHMETLTDHLLEVMTQT